VLNAQLFGGLYQLSTLEADVLTVSLEKIEENHLAQMIAGRPVRYAKKRSLASAAATHVVNWRDL
jgi:ribosome biogenesis protein Tsr3